MPVLSYNDIKDSLPKGTRDYKLVCAFGFPDGPDDRDSREEYYEYLKVECKRVGGGGPSRCVCSKHIKYSYYVYYDGNIYTVGETCLARLGLGEDNYCINCLTLLTRQPQNGIIDLIEDIDGFYCKKCYEQRRNLYDEFIDGRKQIIDQFFREFPTKILETNMEELVDNGGEVCVSCCKLLKRNRVSFLTKCCV